MRPRQRVLEDPRNLGEGAEPAALLLEGAGRGRLGSEGLRFGSPGPASLRPFAPRAPSSGAINLHAAVHQGNAVQGSRWPKALQAEQVQSVTLAPCPPWGKGLSHRRINDMGQGPTSFFRCWALHGIAVRVAA